MVPAENNQIFAAINCVKKSESYLKLFAMANIMQQKKLGGDWMGKLDESLFDIERDDCENDEYVDDKKKRLFIAS